MAQQVSLAGNLLLGGSHKNIPLDIGLISPTLMGLKACIDSRCESLLARIHSLGVHQRDFLYFWRLRSQLLAKVAQIEGMLANTGTLKSAWGIPKSESICTSLIVGSKVVLIVCNSLKSNNHTSGIPKSSQ